jgi:hypothetical protein
LSMEVTLQITVKGLPEESATNLGNTVGAFIKVFASADSGLDLRRMHQVVLTMDFAAEMVELSKRTVSGNPITFTNEEYATAIAKVFIFPRENDYENLLVFNASVIAGLLMHEGSENYDKDVFDTALHFLHHELCHIHDNNKKLDSLAPWMMRHRLVSKNIFIFPLAENCWAEYIANFMSSSSVTKKEIDTMLGSFNDAITRTKPQLDKAIYDYRYHADLEKLMGEFGRHGEFLAKSAAYILGYMDGLGKTLDDLSITTAEKLSGSYFEPTWNSMQKALNHMRELYPDNWKDINIYDGLTDAIESYYSDMGFILSTTENGQAYVKLPFRPETTPPD